MLRSSSHNYATARSGGIFDHALRDSDNAVGVEGLHGLTRAALVTSKNEGLEQPIIKRVLTLFAFLNRGWLTVSKSGDLLGQQLVPKFPTQRGRNLFGDLSGSRTVFPFDGDDSDHNVSNLLDAVGEEVKRYNRRQKSHR